MTSMKLNHFSRTLSMNMDCRVLIPSEPAENEQFPCIWLCHGGSGDESEWLYYSTVVRLVDSRRIAFVIVNANDSCFVDMPYGKNYGTYVGEELPSMIWQMFPCISDQRENNFICGLSNGGYGAFILGLKYWKNFSAIGAFSAGDKADATPKPYAEGEMNPRVRMFGQEDISETDYSMKYLARKLAKEYLQGKGMKLDMKNVENMDNGANGTNYKAIELPHIYHACGSEDPWLELNHKVKKCMEEIDCPEYNYVYHQIDGLGHEWDFWDIELRNFIEYLGL